MDILSDMVGELLILGIDTIVLGVCIRQFYKCKYVSNALESAPILNLDSNLNIEVEKYPQQEVPYAVVRGMVKCLGTPITSTFNPQATGVIQKITLKEHVIARTPAGFWSDETRVVHGIFNSRPFVIQNGKISLEVVDALAAEVIEMDVITDKFEPMNLGMMDHVWGFFSGVRQRGLQTVEEMLTDGSYITVIGEVSKNEEGQMIVHPPHKLPMFLITGSKTSLLNRINSSKDILKILFVIKGSFGVFLIGVIIYKINKKINLK